MKSPTLGQIDRNTFEAYQIRLSVEGKIEATVITPSMHPLIPVGSVIMIRPVREELRPFDIIAFYQLNKIVCHVVIHLNQLRGDHGELIYITRPLRKKHTDLPVKSSDVLGKVENYSLPIWEKARYILGL